MGESWLSCLFYSKKFTPFTGYYSLVACVVDRIAGRLEGLADVETAASSLVQLML